MRDNTVRNRWTAGEFAVSGWHWIGSPYAAEIAGHAGFDCVTIDIQHGLIDEATMVLMMQALSSTPAVPFVRLASADPVSIMKALDGGAYGLICPLVNSAADARRFVAPTMFPPRGERSFGPPRGFLYGGADYFDRADETIVRLAMIETVHGLAAVEEICAVPGIDGIFIGSVDLRIALGGGFPGQPSPREDEAYARCLRAARAAGKRAGVFCANAEVAAQRADAGFDFVVPGADAGMLTAAMKQAAAAFQGPRTRPVAVP